MDGCCVIHLKELLSAHFAAPSICTLPMLYRFSLSLPDARCKLTAFLASHSGVVKLWNTADGQLVNTLEGPGDAIEWLCWHPKGNIVLAGSVVRKERG